MNKLKAVLYITDALFPVIIFILATTIVLSYGFSIKNDYEFVSKSLSKVKLDSTHILNTINQTKQEIDFEMCRLDNSTLQLKTSIELLKQFSNNICAKKSPTAKKLNYKNCNKLKKKQAALSGDEIISRGRENYYFFEKANNSFFIKTASIKDTTKNVGEFLDRTVVDGSKKIINNSKKGINKIPKVACETVTTPIKFLAGEMKKAMVPITYINNSLNQITLVNKQLASNYNNVKQNTQNIINYSSEMISRIIDAVIYIVILCLFVAIWYLTKYFLSIMERFQKGIQLFNKS